MTDELQPFLIHSEIQLKAEQVGLTLDEAGKGALLLYAAYRKRIRAVPEDVSLAAVNAFMAAAGAALVEFLSTAQSVFVMDAVCDLLWNTLDESARYAWLRKVT